MKKITLLFCGVALFAFTGIHQVKAQAVQQGTIIIDPYYGFPNFGKSLLTAVDQDADGFKVTGIGPAGLRVEYLLADRFGIGVDFIYNTFGWSFTDIDSTGANNYNYETKMTRTRIHMRFNYHLMASSEDLDLYVGLGAGTNNRKWTFETNDPAGSDESAIGTLIPFSMRVAFGVRYYFTENIGLNSEIAIGGPLMSLGVSIKF